MKIQTFGKGYLGLQKRIFLNLTNPKRFQRNFEALCLRLTSKFFELVTVFFDARDSRGPQRLLSSF